MNKTKRALISIAFVLLVIDPLGYLLWNEKVGVFAYEFNIWKYKIVYNPVVEKEVIYTFTETHIFDNYISEYNKQEEITNQASKLKYKRIGIINTDNNFIYTIYLNEKGKIIKVADGFDNVDFIAELSINRIGKLVKQQQFEDLFDEIKIPFNVKLKILRIFWFG